MSAGHAGVRRARLLPGHLVQAGEGWAALRPARNPILIFVSSAFGVWGEPGRVVCLAGSWGLSSRGWVHASSLCGLCPVPYLPGAVSHGSVACPQNWGGPQTAISGGGSRPCLTGAPWCVCLRRVWITRTKPARWTQERPQTRASLRTGTSLGQVGADGKGGPSRGREGTCS